MCSAGHFPFPLKIAFYIPWFLHEAVSNLLKSLVNVNDSPESSLRTAHGRFCAEIDYLWFFGVPYGT